MAESSDATIYCRYEGSEFPASEFNNDPEWGRVHETAEGKRHTFMGEDLDDEWELKKLGGG